MTPNATLVSEYLSWQENVRQRSPQTVKSYRSTLDQWLDHLATKPLQEATIEDLEAFQLRPRQRRGHGGTGAAATQRREVTAVRLFYEWAQTRGHLDANPLAQAQAPTVHNVQPKPVSDKAWLKAWAQPMPNGLRAAMGLGYYCGLRRAEIVGLRRDQITPARIVGFTRKGGGEDTLPWRSMVRVYEEHLPHLGAERFVEAMNIGRRGNSEFLTPFRDPDWMNRAMHKAGVSFTPHQLRHSCATNLIRAEVPIEMVSRMLNHSDINITMRYIRSGGDELHSWLRSHRGPA